MVGGRFGPLSQGLLGCRIALNQEQGAKLESKLVPYSPFVFWVRLGVEGNGITYHL